MRANDDKILNGNKFCRQKDATGKKLILEIIRSFFWFEMFNLVYIHIIYIWVKLRWFTYIFLYFKIIECYQGNASKAHSIRKYGVLHGSENDHGENHSLVGFYFCKKKKKTT